LFTLTTHRHAVTSALLVSSNLKSIYSSKYSVTTSVDAQCWAAVMSLVVKEWWEESRDVVMTTELGCITSANDDVGVAMAVTKVNKDT